MFQSSCKFPMTDYWSGLQARSGECQVNSRHDFTLGQQLASPQKLRRSCSPELSSTSHIDRSYTTGLLNPLQRSISTAEQQSRQIAQQNVSYVPDCAVDAIWQAISQRVANVEKPSLLRRYTFEASQCCASQRIRIVHDCCNKETLVQDLVEEPVHPRRVFPTSKLTLCRFCLKNGEPPSVYYGHSLHMDDGRVSCPVLRRYDCPICKNGGGDFAHTVRYCPALRQSMRR